MTERNVHDTLNVDDMLDAIDRLQQQHRDLLSDMQRRFGSRETLASSQVIPAQGALTKAEIDVFIQDIEALLESSKPLKKFEPVAPAEINQSDLMQKKPDTYIPPEKGQSKARKLISAALFYGALLCLIGGAFLFWPGNKKPVFGYYFMNVVTRSMQSEIPQGSMVAVKCVDPGTIKVGDDITYMKDAISVTHRVTGIIENFEGSGKRGFETQGLQNDAPDFEIVHADSVTGKVAFHVPMLGSWLQWLREYFIITNLFIVVFILMVIAIKGVLKKKSNCEQKGAPPDE